MSNQSLTPLMTASSPGVGRASGFKLASRGRLDAANIESALALDDPVAATIGEHWDVLSDQTKPEVLAAIVAGMPALHALRELSSAELMAAVEAERERRAAEENDEEPPGLLDEEWELLSHPTTVRQDDDFRAVPTATPVPYTGLLEQVVQVERLREVQAMLGFTRIDAPSIGEIRPGFRGPLALGQVSWAPAVERRGEGIFLQLREEPVATWCGHVHDHPVISALRHSYARWRSNRDLPPDPAFQIPRYVLVHTLSHLLLRQVALECGYSSASIGERLYVGTPDRPTAGLLLSTAANDSEGTLGGLVALAEARFLERLLEQSLEEAETCSSDPLCAERVPEPPGDQLHAAACHACLFASETSCESGNRWLHRGVLVDFGDGLAIAR